LYRRANGVAAPKGDHRVMTYPRKSLRLQLVADPRPAAASKATSAPGRRDRVAPIRVEGRSLDPARRFEHLIRVYD